MKREQLPLPFGPIRNRNFLSNNWLEHRLCLEPEWTEHRQHAAQLLTELRALWTEQKARVEGYAEATLEEAFIQPILRALGWKVWYQPSLRGNKPDYALFLSDAGHAAAAEAGRNNPAFWDHATLVGDAKSWTVNLDRPVRVENKREYPPEQIERYVHWSACKYGLLTNGRLWRLYPQDLQAYQPRFETYIEFDLAQFLNCWSEAGDKKGQRTMAQDTPLVEDLLRFYLFFSPAAFVCVEARKPLIQRAVEGSNEYRIGVGRELKDRVFDALGICIQGFLDYEPNALNADDHLNLCREHSFVLLYRLLFIMYAEDRGLLPYRTNRLYRENRSLRRLRDDIASQLDQSSPEVSEHLGRNSHDRWDALTELFDLVDTGGKRYGVPAYNGGLFEPDQDAFLTEKILPDWYLARVIDQLSRAPDREHPQAGLSRVDYRDLSIQHLGHVYEGLLELRPKYATEPMVVIRKRGQKVQEKVISSSESLPEGYDWTETVYEPGQVFLVTDKGERRASGSYYTPNHIVDYIVNQTVGEKCRAINAQLESEIGELKAQYRRARGDNRVLLERRLAELESDFDDRILRLTILDPAMGSGHFLLRACQYVAEEIATNPHAGDSVADQLQSEESVLTFWKRRIVEHCLYGADLNPLAVELAKVGLWLETAGINYPLSFLDHHLRWGNSLVGAKVAALGGFPGTETLPLFEQQVALQLPGVLDALSIITSRPSDTVQQVKEKAKVLKDVVDAKRKPFLAVADLWCATYFLDRANQVTPDQYGRALQTIGARNNHARVRRETWFEKAVDVAHSPEVACFHWELEFPEVFFDLSGRREDAGFDIIIGNPPYDVLSEKETGHDLSNLKEFLRAQPVYGPSFRGKNNLYKLFVCRAIDLLCDGGRMGFITPMAVLGDDQAVGIRHKILEEGAFASVDAFPQKDDPERRVFPEAKLSTTVFSLVKTSDKVAKNGAFVSRVHPAQYIEPGSPSLSLSTSQIPLYDPSNLTIVSCSQQDWDLAVRIMRSGRMTRLGDVAEFFQGEVNETNERARGCLVRDAKRGKLVTRGACICLYITRPASQGADLYLDMARFLQGKGPDTKAYHHHHRRVGLQESSPQNNFRRIIAGVISAGEFCNHTVNYCPETNCSVPLELLLGFLNSRLGEWYFRLGSTNAHVSHYQLQNLPYPRFSGQVADEDHALREAGVAAIQGHKLAEVIQILRPALTEAPFKLAVRDIIVELVRLIIHAEQQRGQVARSERSALCAEAQAYQDLIDRLLYAMAGLSKEEARGLETRLATML